MISRLFGQKIAVVTGDVTMDWNIAHQHLEGDGMAWNSQNWTHAYWQRGGAALLADLIEDVAMDLRLNNQTDFRSMPDGRTSQGCPTWRCSFPSLLCYVVSI